MNDQADIEQKQALLKQHRRNLNYLERQAAQYGPDTPLAIHNALTAEQDAIVTIERELASWGISPQPAPQWQALLIDPDHSWRKIIARHVGQLGGRVLEQRAIPIQKSTKVVKTSTLAILGVPDHPVEDTGTQQWIDDVVKLGQSLPLILLTCWNSKDTAIALRQSICTGPASNTTVVTIFKDSFDPGWFARVVHRILIQ